MSHETVVDGIMIVCYVLHVDYHFTASYLLTLHGYYGAVILKMMAPFQQYGLATYYARAHEAIRTFNTASDMFVYVTMSSMFVTVSYAP